MRVIRFSVKFLMAVLAVGLTFAIIFFLTPSWQQSVVEKVLESDTGRQWQVEAVELTPVGIEAAGVFVLQEGAGVEVSQASLSGPVWQIPFTRVVRIESGELRGLVLDLTHVRVGNTATRDWETFLKRISSDTDFWEERIGLLLHKARESGWGLEAQNLAVTGTVLMPGNELIPLEIMILHADSAEPDAVRVEYLADREGPRML